jgi:hypothetical protein
VLFLGQKDGFPRFGILRAGPGWDVIAHEVDEEQVSVNVSELAIWFSLGCCSGCSPPIANSS